MQLLGVGRRASGWLNKSPDGAVQTEAEARASPPSPLHFLSLSPHVATEMGLARAGGMKMARHGGDGEQITQLLVFPSGTFAESWLLPMNSCSAGMAKSKSKEHLSLRVRGSAALRGQSNDYSLLSLPYLRE